MSNCIRTYNFKKITKYVSSNDKNDTVKLQRRIISCALESLKYDMDYRIINAIDNATVLFERAINNNSRYLDEDTMIQKKLRK